MEKLSTGFRLSFQLLTVVIHRLSTGQVEGGERLRILFLSSRREEGTGEEGKAFAYTLAQIEA
jgi:hypothetical protein